MRTIDALLDDYGANHASAANRTIQWICVPPSIWALVALLWSIPFPWAVGSGIVPLNWAVLALLPAQVCCFRLSRRLGMGLMLCSLAMLWLTAAVAANSPWSLWQVAFSVFVPAWAGQAIGRGIEGRRPSFPGDLRFLLVGPAWLLSTVYRRLGLEY